MMGHFQTQVGRNYKELCMNFNSQINFIPLGYTSYGEIMGYGHPQGQSHSHGHSGGNIQNHGHGHAGYSWGRHSGGYASSVTSAPTRLAGGNKDTLKLMC